MDVSKLPARYSKMTEADQTGGGEGAAAHLALPKGYHQKGGKPGVVSVDGQAELEQLVVRPGFLQWRGKDSPWFDFKLAASEAPGLKKQDLMQSLSASHLKRLENKVERGQKTSEFRPDKKPTVQSGAMKSKDLNGYFGDEAPAAKVIESEVVVAETGTSGMKKLMCCAACIAGGGLIVYMLMRKKGM